MWTHLIAIAAVLSGGALFAQAPGKGAQLFDRDCASCHPAAGVGPTQGGRAPSLASLREVLPAAVVAALTDGKMALQGARLSPADRAAVAEFVTGKALPTQSTTLGAPQCTNLAPIAAGMKQPFLERLGGLTNTRFQSAKAAGITASQVPKLKLAWAFGLPRERSPPSSVTGCLPRATRGPYTLWAPRRGAPSGLSKRALLFAQR